MWSVPYYSNITEPVANWLQQFTIYNSQLTIYNSFCSPRKIRYIKQFGVFIIHHSPFTIHHSSFIIHHSLFWISLLLNLAVQAETKQVVVTIKPFLALVSGVMGGVNTPDLLLQGSESPHNYNLKWMIFCGVLYLGELGLP